MQTILLWEDQKEMLFLYNLPVDSRVIHFQVLWQVKLIQ